MCLNLILFDFCRILALEKLGVVFNQMAHPLAKTPRKMIIHPQSGNFILLETDHNTYTRESARAQKKLIAEEMVTYKF
jgi:splicing factor 3B subunit 3